MAGQAPTSAVSARMRVALVTSGLATAAVLVATAPGTPWGPAGPASTSIASEPRRSAPPRQPGHQSMPGMSGTDLSATMERNGATTYSGFIRNPGRTVLVDVAPAKIGVNTVAITVLDGGGKPVKVEQWSATATLPGTTLQDVAVPLKPVADGVAAVDAQLAAAGSWTFTVTVRIAGASTTYTHVVPIGPAA